MCTVMFSGTRPRRELARRPSMDMDRRELTDAGLERPEATAMDNALMKDAGTGTVLDPTGVVLPELSRWPSGVLATFAVSAPASGAARVCVRPSRMDSARLCSSETSSLLLPLGSPSDWSVDGRSLELEDDEADMALAWKSSGSRTTPERRPLWRKRENRLFLTSVCSGMPGVEARDGGPFDRLKSEPLRVVCMTSMCWASPILRGGGRCGGSLSAPVLR